MSDAYHTLMAMSAAKRATLLADLDTHSDSKLEAEYIAMLNECYPSAWICGYEYAAAQALAGVDPTAFRCGFADWLGTDEDYTEIEGQHYLTSDLDDALTALDSQG